MNEHRSARLLVPAGVGALFALQLLVLYVPTAPGPPTPNGRGGEPGVAGVGGAAVGVNAAIVMTGSLGDYEVALPDGVTLPPMPFIR